MPYVGNSQNVFLQDSLALSTLAALTAVTGALNVDGARLEGMKIKKWKGAFTFDGKTTAEGPIVYGLSQDLSPTEVAEFFTADPQHTDDVPSVERANRKVFPMGIITRGSTESDLTQTKLHNLRWPWPEIREGHGISIFAFNANIAAALTTGTILDFQSIMVGEWLDD